MRLEVSCEHRFARDFELSCEFVTRHATTALFGPSGAGKTTLLMMVAGFVTPDRGRVTLNGETLFDTEAGIVVAPETRCLGVVFQDQRLFPHLTVEQNLRFGGRLRSAAAPPFERMVTVLELASLLNRSPLSLSGGERQRVALGRAIMSSPRLLLLDEPVTAVDEPRRETILGYVDRVVDEWEIPMLYVSHHRAEVQRLADWVIVLNGGCITEEGTPDRVLGAGAVVAAGEPLNLIRLTAIDGSPEEGISGSVAVGSSHVRLRLPAGQVAGEAPVFVQFAASDVMLARGDTAGLSARNRLPATVTDLVPRSGRVFVALQVGEQRLWAEITSAAVDDLELAPGLEVTCLIKSAALQVVE